MQPEASILAHSLKNIMRDIRRITNIGEKILTLIVHKDMSKAVEQRQFLEEKWFENAVKESKDLIRAFAADRINEIRFLFKDADYEYEGEVRVIYTESAESSAVKYSMESKVPHVYVDIERELEDLTIRLASRIEDATVDKYVTWLKHTKRVKNVALAKQNRYTT